MITSASLRATSEQITEAIAANDFATAEKLRTRLGFDLDAYAKQNVVRYRRLVEGQSFIWDDSNNGAVCRRVKGGFAHPNGNTLRADADMHDDLVVVLP